MADFEHLPVFEAGCKMPTYKSIQATDNATRKGAEMGSERLLIAMLRYGARDGLPNISATECRRRLEGMA